MEERMPRSAKSTRRELMATAAAATAIAAVGLPVSIKAEPTGDKLLEVIRRYQSEIAAINARGLSDEEIDARTHRADAMLSEGIGLPVLTAAGAVAALDLIIAESAINGDQFEELVNSVRDYVASTGKA
jgi:hypothetical protein